MKRDYGYLMEGDEEALRLDIKTVPALVEDQARWAGIKSGMRVADLGCGAGKTTFHLNRLVRPDGRTVGLLSTDQKGRSGYDRNRPRPRPGQSAKPSKLHVYAENLARPSLRPATGLFGAGIFLPTPRQANLLVQSIVQRR